MLDDNLAGWYQMFSGERPLSTTEALLKAGRFVTGATCGEAPVPAGCDDNPGDQGPALGQATQLKWGEGGTLIEIQGTITAPSQCATAFPCTHGDGDVTFDVADSSWPPPANVHVELSHLFQEPRAHLPNWYGLVIKPATGQRVNIIGEPYCDTVERNHFWHSTNAQGHGTCWEGHPVVAMWPAGSPEPPDQNLFSLVQCAGRSWQVLDQDMPSPCDRQDAATYVAAHNPGIFQANIAPSCRAHDCGYQGTALPRSSANLTFIIPDQADNTHGIGGILAWTAVRAGDTYLAKIVPEIMGTRAYQAGGVIFIVWDIGATGTTGQTLPALVISPLVKPHDVSRQPYNAYSLLATVEAPLHTGTTGRHDATAPVIKDIWARVPAGIRA